MPSFIMPLPLVRIQERMQELDSWAIEGAADLVKEYLFESFIDSIDFVNQVAQIAEKQQHHPTILINYTSVRLTLTTHSEHALSEKDFDLAKAIDDIDKPMFK